MKRQKIARFISLLCMMVILLSIFSCAIVQAMSLTDLITKLKAEAPYTDHEALNTKIESITSGLDAEEKKKLMTEFFDMTDAEKDTLEDDLGLPPDKSWWQSVKDTFSDVKEKFTITGMVTDMLKNIWTSVTEGFAFIEPVKQAIFDGKIDFSSYFDKSNQQGFEYWFGVFTKLGFALIPLILLKVAYLMMASFVNPSYKGELKDFIQTFLVYCFVVFAGRELLAFAVNLNDAFVAMMATEYGKLKTIDTNPLSSSINGIIHLLFAIITLLASGILYIYIRILFFVRAVGVGLAYMLLPLAAVLMFFKKFKKVIDKLVNEIISLIFMQSIYAMTFVLLYSTIAFVLTRIGLFNNTSTGVKGFFGFLLDLFAHGTPSKVSLGPLGLLVFLFMLIKIAEKLMRIFDLNLSFTPGAKDVTGFAATTAGALGTAAAYGADKVGEWGKSATPKNMENKNVDAKAGKAREKISMSKDKLNQLKSSGKLNPPATKSGTKMRKLGLSSAAESLSDKLSNAGEGLESLKGKGRLAALKDKGISGVKTLPGKWQQGKDWLKDKRSAFVGTKAGKFAAFSMASGFKLGLLATGTDGDFNSGYDGLEKAWKKTKGTFSNKKTEGQIELDDYQIRSMRINDTDRVFNDGEDKYAVFKKDGTFEGIYSKNDKGRYVVEKNITKDDIKKSLGWNSYEYSTVDKDSSKYIFTEASDSSTFAAQTAQLYGIQLNQNSSGGSGQTINATGTTTTGGQPPVNVQVSSAQQGVPGTTPIGQSGVGGQPPVNVQVSNAQQVVPGVAGGSSVNATIQTPVQPMPISSVENIQMRRSQAESTESVHAVNVVQNVSSISEQSNVLREIAKQEYVTVKSNGVQEYITTQNVDSNGVVTETVLASNFVQQPAGASSSPGEMTVKTYKVNNTENGPQLTMLGGEAACNGFDIQSLSGAILNMSPKQLRNYASETESYMKQLEGIKDSLENQLKGLKDEFKEGFKEVGQKIGDGFNGVGGEIGQGFKEVSQEMGRGFTDVGQKIDNRMSQVSENIEKKLDDYNQKNNE